MSWETKKDREAMSEWIDMMTGGEYRSGLKLTYRFQSVLEFYRMAMHVTATGQTHKHDKSQTDRDHGWNWYGVKSKEDLMSKKFAWKEKVQEIERDSMRMVHGYKKRIYKYDELDGDDINMERLYEQLPAMKKRIHVSGDKFGNFISLYFNNGVDCGVTAERMLNKTMAAAKLVRFFESLNKRVEVIVYSKAGSPGRYKGERIDYLLTETVVKRFTDPLNVALINTTLSPWFFRYWTLLFFDTRIHTSMGYGYPANLTEEDLKKHKGNRVIKIDAYDCLSEESSNEFIKQVLDNEKTSVI